MDPTRANIKAAQALIALTEQVKAQQAQLDRIEAMLVRLAEKLEQPASKPPKAPTAK